ncbi:MAG: DUF192 domain-containing protein [Candidatus Paceibacterota bacterium]|jgi:hypothetical protein
MKKKISIVIIVCAVLVYGVYLYLNKKSEVQSIILPIQEVQIEGITLKAEVVDTDTERERGLSGHKLLKEDEGMLFVFEKPGIYPFWMKEMLFPIDIMWISSDYKIVYIKKDAQPSSYPETFNPEKSAMYVLEVSSGFSDRHQVKVGDIVSF